jgi:endoglucanase Acf2
MTSWIEGLIRDSNNPSIQDKNFPQFRIFDWFVGHSWSQVYEIYIYIYLFYLINFLSIGFI